MQIVSRDMFIRCYVLVEAFSDNRVQGPFKTCNLSRRTVGYSFESSHKQGVGKGA